MKVTAVKTLIVNTAPQSRALFRFCGRNVHKGYRPVSQWGGRWLTAVPTKPPRLRRALRW